jgi:septum site-determining protein MinC
MATDSKAPQLAFKLKGTAPAITMLVLLTRDLDAIERQLAEQIAPMPHFFLHAPVMLDVEALHGTSVDFVRIAALLRQKRLVPVAVRNLDDAQKEDAIAAGWGVLQTALVRPPPATVASPAPTEAPATGPQARRERTETAATGPHARRERTETFNGLTVRSPVRSGQVVYAPRGDLVALAAVNSGAELVAEGNIHVYAPLRGRALAGVNDNPEASIFCLSLEAEFLSVAGHAMTSEEIPAARRGRPARVHLEDDRLVVSAL